MKLGFGFLKINKIDKPLDKYLRKKREDSNKTNNK